MHPQPLWLPPGHRWRKETENEFGDFGSHERWETLIRTVCSETVSTHLRIQKNRAFAIPFRIISADIATSLRPSLLTFRSPVWCCHQYQSVLQPLLASLQGLLLCVVLQ